MSGVADRAGCTHACTQRLAVYVDRANLRLPAHALPIPGLLARRGRMEVGRRRARRMAAGAEASGERDGMGGENPQQ
jgi:hypothetical protein